MNWNRGFRRITLVLSVASAVAFAVMCAYLSYGMANKGLYWSERSLANARDAACDADAIDFLISSWTTQPSPAMNERETWKEWTGSEFGQEPLWLNDRVVGESEERRKTRLEERTRRLELLKEKGWCTSGGVPLPWTPEEVWPVRRRQITDLESRVRQWQGRAARAAVKGALTGALLGFVPFWVLHAVTYLLVTWIARGFRDNRPREGR